MDTKIAYGILDVFENLIVKPFNKNESWIWLPHHEEYEDSYGFYEEPILFDTEEEAAEGMETIFNYMLSSGCDRTELSFKVIPIKIETGTTYYVDRYDVM